MIDISIIIVSFNTKELTLACLKSNNKYLSGKITFEVIVVDNNSIDGSQQVIEAFAGENDNLSFIETGFNFGFAKANNAGICVASGRQILLLNSDTYLIDDSILRAMQYLDEQHDVFGCGCTLLNADLTVGISYGMFPEFLTVLREIFGGRFGKYRAMKPQSPGCIYDIDLPCGAFFLIKKELLEKTGYLDEQFFMYSEEPDLAKRAKKLGYRTVYFGPTRLVHLGGQSSMPKPVDTAAGKNVLDVKKIFYQSWGRYLVKHHSRLYAFAVKTLFLSYCYFYYFFFGLKKNNEAVLNFLPEILALKAGWGNKTDFSGNNR